jgi:hypothetical protein
MEEFMRAQDLANYFAKKIAKPMAYTYVEPHPIYPTERNYVAEDTVLHAVVTLNSVTGEQVICGEVEVIFKEEDSLSDVLAMAVAVKDDQLDLGFLKPGNPIRRAYNVARKRREEFADMPPQQTM